MGHVGWFPVAQAGQYPSDYRLSLCFPLIIAYSLYS